MRRNRRNTYAIITVIVVAVGLALIPAYAALATQHISTSSGRSAQTIANCHDTDFLSIVSDDVTAFSDSFQKTNINDPLAVITYLRSLAKSRQKYENMEDVSADCYPVQMQMISLYANATEYANLILFKTMDPKNADQYGKDQDQQATRVGDQLDLVLAQMSGEETETP